MDTARYRRLFITETREYLQVMSHLILQLSESPSPEIFDRLFRAAHSIKGMAASMGYHPLKEAAHRMEDLMERLKNGKAAVNPHTVSLLLTGLDRIDLMLTEIEQTGNLTADSDVFPDTPEGLKEPPAMEGAKPELELIPGAEQPSETKWFFKIDVKLCEEVVLPAARAMVAIKRLEDLGKISRLSPGMEEISSGSFQKQFSCYLVTSASAPDIQETIAELPDIAHVEVSPIDPHTRQSPQEAAVSFPSGPEYVRMTSVRVETGRLDRVVEGLGELLILNAHLQEAFPNNPEVASLQILTQKLYDHVLDLRMLPFEALSSTFPRVVYDLCRRLQKKVQVRVQGAEIFLDKAVLDELADPLIHILRNAVDHGIEPPAFRIRQGKNEIGTISISLTKQGDRVLIRIQDDGRGIDPQLIKKTALKKGLFSEKALSMMNQQEILMLITHPGFSTAEKISDISGRGVGMDVVLSRIENLGGSLKIYSVPGQYTRFDIVIPFTIAVLPALLFRSGSMIYAVPSSRVDRLMLLNRDEVHYTQGRPVVFRDNSTLYVEHLEAVLKQMDFPEPKPEFFVFVTEHQNRRIAWIVEELIAEKQIMLKSFGPPLDLLHCYSGATVLGKGEVIPVLDLEVLYRECYQ